MHVLIVEGDGGASREISGFLKFRGHVVDAAGGDIVARHLAQVAQYDAIILDVMYPEMNGLVLCRQLREAGFNTTPILVISVRDSLSDKIACLDAGADEFLTIPLRQEDIESRLQVLIRRNSREKGRMRPLVDQERIHSRKLD